MNNTILKIKAKEQQYFNKQKKICGSERTLFTNGWTQLLKSSFFDVWHLPLTIHLTSELTRTPLESYSRNNFCRLFILLNKKKKHIHILQCCKFINRCRTFKMIFKWKLIVQQTKVTRLGKIFKGDWSNYWCWEYRFNKLLFLSPVILSCWIFVAKSSFPT